MDRIATGWQSHRSANGKAMATASLSHRFDNGTTLNERTDGLTDDLQDLREQSHVPDAPTPVEIASIQSHELLSVDGRGSLCACGARCADWLEHLGEIALALLGTAPLSARSAARGQAQRRAREDALWADRQQREHNLASFQRQPLERKARRHVFTPEQLRIADEWAASQGAA